MRLQQDFAGVEVGAPDFFHWLISQRKKCRECNRTNRAKWRASASPERLRAEAANIKVWRADNAVYVRDQELQKTYGVDLGWYERQLEIQNGHCALCSAIPISAKRQYLCIDHHHDSGKVRELLCNSCNYMLGFLEKKGQIRKFVDGCPDIEWGEHATAYLLRHQ